MTTELHLSESEVTTIVNSLMHQGTPAACYVLRELQTQGVVLGAWVSRELVHKEIRHQAADRTARLNALHTGCYQAGE